MNKIQHLNERQKKRLLVAAIIVFIVASIFGAVVYGTVIRGVCNPPPHNISAWHIADSSVNASILWQIGEDPEIYPYNDWYHSNQFLAASPQYVLYQNTVTHDCGSIFASNTDVIGVDLKTGAQVWTAESPTFCGLDRVIAAQDGFVYVNPCNPPQMLDYSGQVAWDVNRLIRRSDLGTLRKRSFSNLYEGDGSIYATYGDRLQEFSLDRGALIAERPIRVHGLFDGIAAIGIDNTTLAIVDLEANQRELFRIDLDWNISDDFRPGQYILVSDNTLMLYRPNPPTYIKGYNLHTGEHLWRVNRDFPIPPIVVSGKLIVYTPYQNLEFYDPATGGPLGYVELEHDPTIALEESIVYMAGIDNVVVLEFRSALELVAIQLDL